MAKVSQLLGNIANILSGAQPLRPNTPEYYEVSSKEDLTSTVYLVTYSSHGLLPTFDPACLISLVHSIILSFLFMPTEYRRGCAFARSPL